MISPIAIDLAIILVIALYLVDGYRRGFLLLGLEFIGTILTFYLAWTGSEWVGQWPQQFINYPEGLERLIGFTVLWFILQAVYIGLSTFLYPRIPDTLRNSVINKVAGLIPSTAKGLLIIAVILTLGVVLPFDNPFRPAILASRLGQPIVTATQSLQQQFAQRYSQELTETFTFLTTTPIVRKTTDHTETIKLHFTTNNGVIAPQSEAAMLDLLNKERVKQGLNPLTADTALREVGRTHARDMLARGYFSHYSPEGTDPFDRIETAGIRYLTAGENLAFAPTVELAHVGLMNSPKHRDNILYPEFGKVGIGVIDSKLYGQMFVQVFSN